jgi:hypothetical protein
MDESLAPREYKPEVLYSLGPAFVDWDRSAKDDVIAVDSDGVPSAGEEAEREVVLETEEREAEEVTHKLPPGLEARGVRANQDATEGIHCYLLHCRWYVSAPFEYLIENSLGYLDREIIGCGLVIPRNENLAFLPLEAGERDRCRFTTKKPILLAHM